MNDASITRPSRLLRMRDVNDDAAWSQFVEIYTPLIFGYCRGRGLQEGDAADVAQEAMRAVAKAIGKFEYDPQRGKFRNQLLTVVQRPGSFLSRRTDSRATDKLGRAILALEQTPAGAGGFVGGASERKQVSLASKSNGPSRCCRRVIPAGAWPTWCDCSGSSRRTTLWPSE